MLEEVGWPLGERRWPTLLARPGWSRPSPAILVALGHDLAGSRPGTLRTHGGADDHGRERPSVDGNAAWPACWPRNYYAADNYGANYERLSAVKAAYDPDNLFHVNQNIAPAKRR